ncbi:hypothetical protein T4A_7174 [Trichinella pseudospiralis]|uniref:Uncharacterized protein n=1 Tax=Trichinella pseudospiralis TaxID=6337 RepID=A0A0V1DY26_TRIPS|nr:hypothetical protein T4A_7174 [Trichinella pseudospiralis]
MLGCFLTITTMVSYIRFYLQVGICNMDDVTSALSLYPVHSNTTEKDFNSLGEKPHWQHSVILKWIEETRQLSGKKRANLMARKQSVHCIMLMEFIWRKRRRSEADPATCSVGLLLFEGSFGHIRAPWLKGFRSVGTNRRGPGKMLGYSLIRK